MLKATRTASRALLRTGHVTSAPLLPIIQCRRFAHNAEGALSGKVALITGAGGGLGRSIAERFAQAGASVAVADLNRDAAKETVSLLQQKSGAQHVPIEMNVTSESSVEEGVTNASQALGSLDVVLCNAGIQHICPVDELALADWKKVLAVHMDGTFLCTRAAVRYMKAHNIAGKILIMGSVHSKEASVLKSPYVAAKHGVLGFARAVAKEVGPHGIAVNTICPGFVYTPLVEKQIPEQAKNLGISEEEVVKKVMLGGTVDGEFATLDDIADVSLFVASHPNNALTGQSFNVSHGWVMN